MTDLEQRLRDDLTDAAEALPADLDVDALIRQGRRRRMARAQRRGFAAVAAATVVGLVAWLGLTPSSTTGVPEPASTPTTTALATSLVFWWEPGTAPRSPYEVITTSVKDGVLTVTGRKPSSDTPETLASVPLNRTVATGTAISPRLSLWTIPGRIDWVDVVTNEASDGSYAPRDGYLSGAGVTVVVAVAQKDQARKNWVGGVIWRAMDGTLHSSAGTTVSTATLQFSDRSLIVYRDPGLGQISFFDPMEGRGFTSIRDTGPANVLKIQVSRGNSASDWEQFAMGILPPGARDPRVTTTSKGAEVVTGVLQPDGAEVFMALHHGTAEPKGPFVTTVTYTDAQGRTRTYRS